jgi:RHS repeat-associated protein
MDFDSVSVCSAAFAYIGARPRTYHPQMTVRLAGGPRLAFETWGRLITKPTPEGTLNYTFDLAGNVSSIYSSSQHGASMSYTYDAFGNLLSSPGPTPNNYLYRGEQYDPDLGLYYLRARYYNPQTGRFLSRDPEDGDPLDPKTLHKYLYAGGNPINRIDPSGKDDFLEYVGNVSSFLSHYNGANNPNRYAQCQAGVYAGIASELVNPTQSEEIINALGAAEGKCVEDLLNGIISPVPRLPWN